MISDCEVEGWSPSKLWSLSWIGWSIQSIYLTAVRRSVTLWKHYFNHLTRILLLTRFWLWVTGWIPIVEQDILTHPKHRSSTSFLIRVHAVHRSSTKFLIRVHVALFPFLFFQLYLFIIIVCPCFFFFFPVVLSISIVVCLLIMS
jgi:hypothetical protein